MRTTEAGDDSNLKRLPDLTLTRIGDLRLIRTNSGGLQLRFSSTVNNVGSGPIVVKATRKRVKDDFAVAQRVHTVDGRRPYRTIPVKTVFAGDGHTHHHIRDVVRYTLTPLEADNPTKLRRIKKVGFCLYDNVRRAARPGQPSRPGFPRAGCGTRNSTTLRMGLSVGWGDKYVWTLLGQFVSLTGLPVGDYRLLGRANPDGAFYEQRIDNNTVYTDIRLRREPGKGASIKILRSGGRVPETVVETAGTTAPAHDHGDPPSHSSSGVVASREVDYAAWHSTRAPLTQF